jgi:hypothetical protein
MPGSSSRTQDFDQRLASALSSAITGVVITTTTGGSATTTAATFVVGIALSTVVASSIAAVFPAACAGWAVTATAAVATTATTATTAVATTATTAVATATATTAVATATTAVATATTAAAVAAAATAAAATTWGASARLSLIDTKRAAHEFSALETFDSSFFGCIVGHFDKSKSALSAGIPLEGKGTIHDFTELSKQLSHVLLLSAEGKVANKNAHVLRGPGTKKWTKGAWNIAIGP